MKEKRNLKHEEEKQKKNYNTNNKEASMVCGYFKLKTRTVLIKYELFLLGIIIPFFIIVIIRCCYGIIYAFLFFYYLFDSFLLQSDNFKKSLKKLIQ